MKSPGPFPPLCYQGSPHVLMTTLLPQPPPIVRGPGPLWHGRVPAHAAAHTPAADQAGRLPDREGGPREPDRGGAAIGEGAPVGDWGVDGMGRSRQERRQIDGYSGQGDLNQIAGKTTPRPRPRPSVPQQGACRFHGVSQRATPLRGPTPQHYPPSPRPVAPEACAPHSARAPCPSCGASCRTGWTSHCTAGCPAACCCSRGHSPSPPA